MPLCVLIITNMEIVIGDTTISKLKYMALVFLVSKSADILDWRLMILVASPLQNNWSHYCDNLRADHVPMEPTAKKTLKKS